MRKPRLSFLLVLMALAAAPPASAKVAFTGYADTRFNAGTSVEIKATPAALASFPTLSNGKTETRGFSADAIGIFASTELREDMQFLIDFTYRTIGQNVGVTRIQYAYLNWTPTPDIRIRAGKVTLPFGFYNENRFYAFQRHQILSPFFQSSILGLPIADWGVVFGHRVPLTDRLNLRYSLYSVNGYGNVATATTPSLRAPSIPGGLAMSGNLRATDNNHEQAVGARVRLQGENEESSEIGGSVYRGVWDAAGKEPLQMLGAHAHLPWSRFDFLWEGLRMDVKGDTGFGPALGGGTSWKTLGHFGKVAFTGLTVKGKPVVPFVQLEEYFSKKAGKGGAREKLTTASTGFSVDVAEGLRLKAELFHLFYRIPFEHLGAGENIVLKADIVQLAMVITF